MGRLCWKVNTPSEITEDETSDLKKAGMVFSNVCKKSVSVQ